MVKSRVEARVRRPGLRDPRNTPLRAHTLAPRVAGPARLIPVSGRPYR